MTKQQTLVYEFIKAYIKVKGHPPSYADIASGMGMKARSNIHRMVHKMRHEGVLSLKSKRYRTIQLQERFIKTMSSL